MNKFLLVLLLGGVSAAAILEKPSQNEPTFSVTEPVFETVTSEAPANKGFTALDALPEMSPSVVTETPDVKPENSRSPQRRKLFRNR